MLVGLPTGHTADVVADALATKIGELPAQFRRSLTWHQGKEMAAHSKFTVASGVSIAAELNGRPRKTLEFMTPAQALEAALP